MYSTVTVSIPHMGCMPYGRRHMGIFPKGTSAVSIPHMGCMPYGQLDPDYESALRGFQSLIWVACPTGFRMVTTLYGDPHSFNPSYGLHALRARKLRTNFQKKSEVSIPHMGCMPYGQVRAAWPLFRLTVSIPHMGCMPYGRPACRCLD